jgi:uncharacterized RDD family membrane protein YckC
MSNYDNPYAAPQAELIAPTLSPAHERIVPVGNGTRFLNLIIDSIARLMLSWAFFFCVGVVCVAANIEIDRIAATFLGILFALAYYMILEGLTQRTVGKFVTGTIVVRADGSKPSFGQIVGRTFARIIPFEPFSFFGAVPRGWHDTLSDTYVVKI